jgi:hypothetical protein
MDTILNTVGGGGGVMTSATTLSWCWAGFSLVHAILLRDASCVISLKLCSGVTLRLERGIGLCIAIVEMVMCVFPYF